MTLRGRTDRSGRLIHADPALAQLHEDAGGEPNGPILVPQIAALVQLAADLDMRVEQPVLVADGLVTRALFGTAQPDLSGVDIVLTGWENIVPPPPLQMADAAEAAFDYARLEADGAWATDSDLKITRMAAGVDRAIGFLPATARGSSLPRQSPFRTSLLNLCRTATVRSCCLRAPSQTPMVFFQVLWDPLPMSAWMRRHSRKRGCSLRIWTTSCPTGWKRPCVDPFPGSSHGLTQLRVRRKGPCVRIMCAMPAILPGQPAIFWTCWGIWQTYRQSNSPAFRLRQRRLT